MIVDASVILSAFFPDEDQAQAQALIREHVMGRVTLAAGRLESALKQYVSARVPGSDTDKATLGRLIGYCEKRSCLDRLLPALRMLKEQRNYLIHSIYALLFGLVEETILEGSGLVDSDVATYTERAWQLKENLLGLAEVVEGA